jgi:hypothetical protein
MGIEGLGAHAGAVLVRGENRPASAFEAEPFESAYDRIDEPRVSHAMLGVDGQLFTLVDLDRGLRENLADPVGRQGEIRHVGDSRHARPTPAGKVRDQDVVAQMELGLVQQNPPARSAPASLEGRPKLFAKRRRRGGVRACGTRMCVQDAMQELGDQVVGRRQDVLIRGVLAGGIGHFWKVADAGFGATSRPWRLRPRRSSLTLPIGKRNRAASDAAGARAHGGAQTHRPCAHRGASCR